MARPWSEVKAGKRALGTTDPDRVEAEKQQLRVRVDDLVGIAPDWGGDVTVQEYIDRHREDPGMTFR